MDTLTFTCDVCNREVPAKPNMMFETGVTVEVCDGEGESWQGHVPPQVTPEDLAGEPLMAKFASGAVCICPACQQDLGIT